MPSWSSMRSPSGLFVAKGRLEGVDTGLRLGDVDWRDLLVAGRVAHQGWPAVLDSRLGPVIG